MELSISLPNRYDSSPGKMHIDVFVEIGMEGERLGRDMEAKPI